MSTEKTVQDALRVMREKLVNHNRGITLLLQTLTQMQTDIVQMGNIVALLESKLPTDQLIGESLGTSVIPELAAAAGKTAPLEPFEETKASLAAVLGEAEARKEVILKSVSASTEANAAPPQEAPIPAIISPEVENDVANRAAALMPYLGQGNYFISNLSPAVRAGGKGEFDSKLKRYKNDILTTKIETTLGWPTGIYCCSSTDAPQLFMNMNEYLVIVGNLTTFDPSKMVLVKRSGGVWNLLQADVDDLKKAGAELAAAFAGEEGSYK